MARAQARRLLFRNESPPEVTSIFLAWFLLLFSLFLSFQSLSLFLFPRIERFGKERKGKKRKKRKKKDREERRREEGMQTRWKIFFMKINLFFLFFHGLKSRLDQGGSGEGRAVNWIQTNFDPFRLVLNSLQKSCSPWKEKSSHSTPLPFDVIY